ncbi:MAG TPA: D-alanyl-D-alanine carboxypeptidase [Candidatus Dormibacteraeota bacterium]|nr:D-alanyl-D-alanine carboxypeptidase [Candidatus Dormibacteraeota bacterium]
MKGLAARLGAQQRRNLAITLALALAPALVIGLVAFQLLRPLPAIAATTFLPATSRLGAVPPPLPWPTTGSAAVAVAGLGTIGTHGPQTSLPLASTAKVMTALVVLADRPLRLTEQGPPVPVSAADVATYMAEKNQGQSVFPVAAGEKLSEYQALQALLVPSGNNIAELLAAWDAGSVAAFVDKMNARAATLQLLHTHYVDASGLSPQSVGTPEELIALAEAALQDPVFAEIVAQPEATLPVAGRVFNVDAVVGQDGIVGVKTGSSGAAGACFVFAADVRADGQPARLFGAILGLPTLDDAFTSAKSLVQAVGSALHYRSVLSTNQVIAEYAAPWGDTATVFADQDLNWVVYDGMVLQQRTDLRTVRAPLPSGSRVGTLTLQLGEQRTQLPLKTTEPIFAPDTVWRLTRVRLDRLFQ